MNYSRRWDVGLDFCDTSILGVFFFDSGLAEAFIGTFKRDYVNGAELRDAETVLTLLGGWIDDYNTQAPHSALGMRSPVEYRSEQLTLSYVVFLTSSWDLIP